MHQKIVQDAMDQPGCEHNSSKGASCVDKPSGGESCAFDGAYIVLNPIRDALHIVHGGITCGAHNYESRGSFSSGSKLYRYGMSTDISELEIVYGAEDKLYSLIVDSVREFSPAAVFVYLTCVPAMVGEDSEAICKRAEEACGVPIIVVNAPGFLGHKNLGNRLAGETLLEQVIGTRPAIQSENPSINIIGEYNIAGDLWNVLPLFQKIGIEINACITGDEDYDRICRAHGADFNLLVCSRAMINLAAGMYDRYGIDYSEASFFGVTNTKEAYLNVITQLEKIFPEKKEKFQKAVSLIEREAKKITRELIPYIEQLRNKKAVIYSGGVKSWSLISCLADFGIETVAVGTKKSGAHDMNKIEEIVGAGKMVSDTSAKNMMKLIREHNAEFFIAGSRNQYLAYKEKVAYIDVNQERESSYGGFSGAVNFARDLCYTLNSPAMSLAKEAAPWERA